MHRQIGLHSRISACIFSRNVCGVNYSPAAPSCIYQKTRHNNKLYMDYTHTRDISSNTDRISSRHLERDFLKFPILYSVRVIFLILSPLFNILCVLLFVNSKPSLQIYIFAGRGRGERGEAYPELQGQ